MKRIVKILSQLALTQVILAFSAVLRNKVMAWRLGVGRFGAYSLVGSASLMFYSFSQFGLGLALSRNIAAAETMEERQELLSTGNGLTLISSLLVFLVCGVTVVGGMAPQLFGFSSDPHVPKELVETLPWMLLVLVALSWFESWRQNNFALLQGIIDLKGISAERAYGVLAVSIVSIPIVWYFGIWGAIFQAGLLTVWLAIVHAHRVHQLGYHPLALKFDAGKATMLMRYGFAAFLTASALTVSDVWLRTSLEHHWGLIVVALFTAGAGLMGQVKTVFLSSIVNYSISVLSAAKTLEDQSKACAEILEIILPPCTLIIGGTAIVAPILVPLIYTHQYVAGASIVGVLAIGDYLQSVDYVLGGPILGQGRVMAWVWTEFMLLATRTGVGLVLMSSLGLYAIPTAAAAGMGLHLLVKAVLYRRLCKLEPLPGRIVFRFWLGLAAICSVAAVLALPGILPRIVAFGILSIVLVVDIIKFDMIRRVKGIIQKRKAGPELEFLPPNLDEVEVNSELHQN